MRVYCLPFAGAGAGVFRRQQLDGLLALHPVQPPGREERIAEPALCSVPEIAADCVARMLPVLPDAPFALFGHSFGAYLAFEVAAQLGALRRPASRVVVSGAAAPHVPRRPVGARGRTDEALLEGLRELVGYDHPALRHPGLRRLLLPTLRADLVAQDDYHRRQTVDCRLTALYATGDMVVREDQMLAWAELTTAAFDLTRVAGGHMWMVDDWPLLWATLERSLAD